MSEWRDRSRKQREGSSGPAGRTGTGPRPALAIGAALCAMAAWAALGCSRPQPLEPPLQGEISIVNGAVSWTTNDPTLGSVRFGNRRGEYRAVAYPAAAGRGDKSYTREHRVPLLTAASGETLYLQALDETSIGSVTASAERMWVSAGPASVAPLLVWTMIDVGFGDCHLLTMPTTGRTVLVDAGERRDWPNVDLALRTLGLSRLDAVLATHVHEDHIGGLVGQRDDPDDGVLGAWTVGSYLEGGNPSADRDAEQELLGILATRHIPRTPLSPGDTDESQPALAWDPAVSVTALNAGGGHAIGGESENDWINNDSVVLRVSYGDVDLVLGGDAESPVQARLLTLGVTLESEALKVHHHGLDDSSSPVYLSTVNPRVGMIPIVTYESNAGTLPSAIVLARLRERHVDVYASDRALPLGVLLSGDAGLNVTWVTDGASYEVRILASSSRHYAGSLVISGAHEEGATP